MVCGASPIPPALHSDQFVLGKPNRAWFAEITSKRIRRGTFRSVRKLIRAIDSYIRGNNKEPKPFVWTATAASILRKLTKYKETLETPH